MESKKDGQQTNGLVQTPEHGHVLRKSSPGWAVWLLPFASALSILTSIGYLAGRARNLLALGGTHAMWMAFLVEVMASCKTRSSLS